jgi:ABC-type polysaccharide/polyol phosphate export permease
MTAQTIGFVVVFPLTFASNAFVPTDNMPAALKAFAEWNPVSSMVQAVRDLFGNLPALAPEPTAWSLQNPGLYSAIWIVIIGVVGLSLAVWRYSKGRDK